MTSTIHQEYSVRWTCNNKPITSDDYEEWLLIVLAVG